MTAFLCSINDVYSTVDIAKKKRIMFFISRYKKCRNLLKESGKCILFASGTRVKEIELCISELY